jgi:hypothetical protein
MRGKYTFKEKHSLKQPKIEMIFVMKLTFRGDWYRCTEKRDRLKKLTLRGSCKKLTQKIAL